MSRPFPEAARAALGDTQLRHNLRVATHTIRAKREAVVAEVEDWEELREAGKRIKEQALGRLDVHLERLEASVTAAGGTVHWARDGAEANAIIARLVHAAGSTEAIKVKSIATDEIGLNDALTGAGITAIETDLAELIVQLGHDRSSHILVPAIHRNRSEIRELFRRELPGNENLSDEPAALAEAARRYLGERFPRVPVGISGANFAVAETGAVCVVESEGNGRMCTTLPRVLITVMGIEKVLPEFRDLEVMLMDQAPTLPWASSLCGACYEVCPVKIDIPSVLLHLRGRIVREQKSRLNPEHAAMRLVARAFATRRGYESAQRLFRVGRGPIAKLPAGGPLAAWTAARDLPPVPAQSFRDWWRARS